MEKKDIPWFLGGDCKIPIKKMPGAFSKYYFEAFKSGELIPNNSYMETFYETDKTFIINKVQKE